MHLQLHSLIRRHRLVAVVLAVITACHCPVGANEAAVSALPGLDRIELKSAAVLSPGRLVGIKVVWDAKKHTSAAVIRVVFKDPNGAMRAVSGFVKTGIVGNSIEAVGIAPVMPDWTDGVYTLLHATVSDGNGCSVTYLPDGTLQGEPATLALPSGHALSLRELQFTVTGSVASEVTITGQPRDRAVGQGESTTLDCTASGRRSLTFQWRKNGRVIEGAAASAYGIAAVQPADTGCYTTDVGSGATAERSSEPAILGLTVANKTAGAGRELQANIRHPNGNTFDQVALTGAAEAITADYDPDPAKNQITRTSFIDLDNDIVQVEFSGPGTLSLVLEGASAPAAAANYNQPGVEYVKGHAGIVIAGATEQTNVSVFSVGKATAVNQALFKDGAKYDGIADIAFIAILSANGKFGGVRTANANYFASKGHTGIYAPGVEFTGPVYVGDVTAFDTAQPVIVLGSASEVRITGGDMFQDNGAPVQVSGIAQLKFTAGADSHGNPLSAQANRALFHQNGIDVTVQVVANP